MFLGGLSIDFVLLGTQGLSFCIIVSSRVGSVIAIGDEIMILFYLVLAAVPLSMISLPFDIFFCCASSVGIWCASAGRLDLKRVKPVGNDGKTELGRASRAWFRCYPVESFNTVAP